MRQNFYVFSLYRNPDLDDCSSILGMDVTLTLMAVKQAEDMCLFPVAGLSEWPSSRVVRFTATNHHGVATFDFATVYCCDQLVVDPTHARGGTLYLILNDVLT